MAEKCDCRRMNSVHTSKGALKIWQQPSIHPETFYDHLVINHALHQPQSPTQGTGHGYLTELMYVQ